MSVKSINEGPATETAVTQANEKLDEITGSFTDDMSNLTSDEPSEREIVTNIRNAFNDELADLLTNVLDSQESSDPSGVATIESRANALLSSDQNLYSQNAFKHYLQSKLSLLNS